VVAVVLVVVAPLVVVVAGWGVLITVEAAVHGGDVCVHRWGGDSGDCGAAGASGPHLE
jgi:hypothetical protein